ncbi:MAG: polyphenol oxidase family protein [Oscillospiraceae bacterium]|nr:polyphenol oxidase family protein [Oscillospiraceae bacterium]
MSRDVQIITSPLLTCPHGFSTRTGGVSTGIFESLNLGSGRGESLENIEKNWVIFGRAVGLDTSRFVCGPQVHGGEVRIARREDAHSVREPAPWKPGVDGYVTDIPGLPLVIFTADCAPLLLHDPVAGVVGAAHCGWRGTAADMMASVVEKMALLGARPENIRAVIGPGIRQCCFQTGPEVPEALGRMLGGDTAGLFRPDAEPGKFRVDLPGAVARRLEQLGLAPEHIGQTGQCTMCHPELFWSHRSMGNARGSQANIIAL